MQWALTESWNIPYGTSIPLADTRYREAVEAAGREAERERVPPPPHPLDVEARDDEELYALHDARTNVEERIAALSEPPSPPQEGSTLPLRQRIQLQHRPSVMRQRRWMQNQLNARKLTGSAGGAKYNGKTLCPLCLKLFHVGELMVMCHIDPDPAPVWIHVTCANLIMELEGRDPLIPR
mmetsp:Transcript_48529/g.99085  ORF Transcript_48529/g.99085 Transcript_48529/m.99085 type:complete len:180 (-) Transcript_48529:66-605(-)